MVAKALNEILGGMRKFSELISIFDWITPAAAGLEILDKATIDTWTFYIPNDFAIDRGWDSNSILGLMSTNGIETWASSLHLGEFFFTVYLEDAAKAEQILNNYDVPIYAKSQGAPNVKRRSTNTDPS